MSSRKSILCRFGKQKESIKASNPDKLRSRTVANVCIEGKSDVESLLRVPVQFDQRLNVGGKVRLAGGKFQVLVMR